MRCWHTSGGDGRRAVPKVDVRNQHGRSTRARWRRRRGAMHASGPSIPSHPPTRPSDASQHGIIRGGGARARLTLSALVGHPHASASAGAAVEGGVRIGHVNERAEALVQEGVGPCCVRQDDQQLVHQRRRKVHQCHRISMKQVLGGLQEKKWANSQASRTGALDHWEATLMSSGRSLQRDKGSEAPPRAVPLQGPSRPCWASQHAEGAGMCTPADRG